MIKSLCNTRCQPKIEILNTARRTEEWIDLPRKGERSRVLGGGITKRVKA